MTMVDFELYTKKTDKIHNYNSFPYFVGYITRKVRKSKVKYIKN